VSVCALSSSFRFRVYLSSYSQVLLVLPSVGTLTLLFRPELAVVSNLPLLVVCTSCLFDCYPGLILFYEALVLLEAQSDTLFSPLDPNPHFSLFGSVLLETLPDENFLVPPPFPFITPYNIKGKDSSIVSFSEGRKTRFWTPPQFGDSSENGRTHTFPPHCFTSLSYS